MKALRRIRDECEKDYEAGSWLDLVLFAKEEQAWLNYHGLDCDGEAVEEGCSVAGESSPLALLALFGLVGLRRRQANFSAH